METIDDILREIRKLAKEVQGNSISNAYELLMGLADRIEVAVKHQFREVTKTIPNEVVVAKMETTTPTCKESLQVGNAAELREVCQKMVGILMSHGDGRTHCILTWDEFNDAQMMIRAALSAPARNCDRQLIVDGPANNVADKAWIAFKHCNPNAYFDVSGLLRCIEWLFAEAKGEEK